MWRATERSVPRLPREAVPDRRAVPSSRPPLLPAFCLFVGKSDSHGRHGRAQAHLRSKTHTRGFPTEDVMTVHLEKTCHNLTTLKKKELLYSVFSSTSLDKFSWQSYNHYIFYTQFCMLLLPLLSISQWH